MSTAKNRYVNNLDIDYSFRSEGRKPEALDTPYKRTIIRIRLVQTTKRFSRSVSNCSLSYILHLTPYYYCTLCAVLFSYVLIVVSSAKCQVLIQE